MGTWQEVKRIYARYKWATQNRGVIKEEYYLMCETTWHEAKKRVIVQ